MNLFTKEITFIFYTGLKHEHTNNIFDKKYIDTTKTQIRRHTI
jgi:hypothetical protein